jgi:hypothetical protein
VAVCTFACILELTHPCANSFPEIRMVVVRMRIIGLIVWLLALLAVVGSPAAEARPLSQQVMLNLMVDSKEAMSSLPDGRALIGRTKLPERRP